MCFWLALFCSTLVINSCIMEIPKFVFDHIPLGHSGVLITWKSNMSQNEANSKRSFGFLMFNKYGTSETFEWISQEQHDIMSLKENTFYEIFIRQYFYGADGLRKMETQYPALVITTKRRTNTKPAKPDFTRQYYYIEDKYNYLTLYWLPCGKDRNCHKNEAGTHFAVKFRAHDRRGEYRLEPINKLGDSIGVCYFMPGIQYEAIVISINGEYETESDPQEIYFNPMISGVTSVIVVSLPDQYILVSWKKPKYALEKLTGYLVAVANDTFADDTLFPLYEENNMKNFISLTIDYANNVIIDRTVETEKLFQKQKYQLEAGKTYTFCIIPVGQYHTGLETRVKYTVPIDEEKEKS